MKIFEWIGKRYIDLFVGDLAKKLKDIIINHPDEWENSFYTIKHTKSGLELMCQTSIRVYKGQDFSSSELVTFRYINGGE